MFCPECGFKNREDAAFCEKCGADLSKALQQVEATQQTSGKKEQKAVGNEVPLRDTVAPKQPKRPIKTSTKVIVGCVLAAAVAATVLFQVGSNLTSPERVASDYFGALRSHDWSRAYSCLDISSGPFLTEQNFAETQKAQKDGGTITDYEVVPSSNSTSDLLAQTSAASQKIIRKVNIQYTTSGMDSASTEEITLTRQPEKKWLFFDTWKVSPASYLISNVNITVPTGATVSLDGVKLGTSYQSAKNESSGDSGTGGQTSGASVISYTIPRMFAGNHVLKAVSPYIQEFTQTITVNKNATSFSFGKFSLKQDVLDTVSKKAEEVIQSVYSAALNQEDYSRVSENFAAQDDYGDDAGSNIYNQIRADVATDSEGGLKSVSFSELASKATDCSTDGAMEVQVITSCAYTYTAVPFTYGNSETVAPVQGSNTSEVQLVFRLIDGKWKVESANNLELPYNSMGY